MRFFLFRPRRTAGGALSVLCLALAACSPSHNWRLSRLDGVPVQALMPCKPERAQREVPLWGMAQPPVRLTLMSCAVGEHTFAVAALPLQPGVAAETARQASQAWMRAGWASLRLVVQPLAEAPVGWQARPQSVPGAVAAQRWSGPGLNHLGQPLQAQWLMADNGRWLVQAALYGPPVADDVATTFFDALRFE